MRRNAQRRGKALERRVAEKLDGLLHPGQAGDVLVLGRDGTIWVLEVKYRKGYLLDRKDQLGRWVEQAKSNAARRGRGEKWALVLYGGRGTEILFLSPLSWVEELFAGMTSIREVVKGELEDESDGLAELSGAPEAVPDGEGNLSSGAGPEDRAEP